MPHSSSSSSTSFYDEGERLSVRTNNTGSGSSVASIRHSQSGSDQDSIASGSHLSVHSVDTVLSERDISSPRLQRTDSQDSSVSSSGSRVASECTNTGSSSEGERESEIESQESEASVEEQGFRERLIEQEEEQCPTENIEESINAERRRDSSPYNTGTSICRSSELRSDTLLQGRGGSGEESSMQQRSGSIKSPVVYVISKSLASNFGDVLTKTSGLATALGRVVSMPVRGTIDGVESFGLYLKGKQKNENSRDIRSFYKNEWTPIIVAVAETFDSIQYEKEESDKFLSELCNVLEDSFKTIDADQALIVGAVEAIERRIAKVETKRKQVSFQENGSQLQSDVVKLSSKIIKMQDEMEDKIEEVVERQLQDIVGTAEFKERFKKMEMRVKSLEKELELMADQVYRVNKSSEEFRANFAEKFHSPVKQGIGNILRNTKFNSSADMEKPQPVQVGQEERDTVIQNAPEETHVEKVLISGRVQVNDFTDAQFPSESMPAVARFDWTTTQSSGVVFAKYDFPELLIKHNEYLKRDFSQFQYFTCDGIKLVITTTSNCFQGGHLGVTWDPFSTASSCGVVNSIPLSNLYTFEIPAGDSCVREIIVPFVCQQNLLNLAGTRQNAYSMGSLLFHPLNQLRVPKDTAQKINITLYAQFIKPVFKVQTLIHDMYPESSTSSSRVNSAMEVLSPIVSDIIRLDEVPEYYKEPEIIFENPTYEKLEEPVSKEPEISKIAIVEPPIYKVPEVIMPLTPVVIPEKFVPQLPTIEEKPVLEKMKQLEEKIEHQSESSSNTRSVPSLEVPSVQKQPEEKKQNLDPKKFDKNGNPYSMSNPFKIYPYYISSMGNHPDKKDFQDLYWANKLIEKSDGRYFQIYPQADGVFGGMSTSLKVDQFINENIVHMGSWKSTDTGKLVSLNCSPVELVRQDTENFYLPSLAHIGALFKHWRGSLIYKMTIGANSLSRGKLRLAALPEQKIFADPDFSKINFLPGAVYDLNASQKSVEIVVPFNHTQNYQYTNMEYFCDSSFHGEMILTRLYVYVVDQLMTNTGSNDTVDYFITVRPGPDFEYCTPIGINMGSPMIPKAQISEEGEGIENPSTKVARDGNTKGFITSSETNAFDLERGYILNDTLSHKECITLNVGPVLQSGRLCDNPTAWVSTTHTRWRGSIDYEFMVSGHNANIAKTILIYYVPYGYETPNDIVKNPYYLPSSGLKFVTWDLRQSSKCTIKIRWTSPLQSLFVANDQYGKTFPDNLMFNGRICLSLLGTPTEEVSIVGFVRAGEDFQLFDKAPLRTIGKATNKVLPLTQYKIIKAINETPVDKSEYVSSMPWPIENAYDPTKKLKPVSAEHAEMKKTDYATLEKNFISNVRDARKKANAKANMEVQADMMSWVNPFILGRENAAALDKLNLPKTIEGINNLVESKGLCKMAAIVDKVSVSDMDRISAFIQGLTPLLDESSKTLPKIMQQSSEGLEKASEGMSLLSTIGKKIMDWATTLIDLSLPGYIKSLHEHGEFVFALLATLGAIVMFIWWYRNTTGASFISRTLTLICLMWAPLLGKGLFNFSLWLFSTFKEVLESTVTKLSEKFGWFTCKEGEVARTESIALQYVVSDMEVEGWIGKLFHDPTIIFTPILMIGAALIALKTLGRPTKQQENSSFMQRCGTLVKQFQGIASLAAFIATLKSVAEKWGKITLEWVHWMLGTEVPEDAAVQLGVEFEVKQWMDDVLDCSREETIHKLVADPEGVHRVRLLYERGKIINKALLEKKNLPHTFAVLLRPLIESTKKMVDEAHKSKGSGEMRKDPFMIVMFGPPGQGKSATTELLVSDLLDMHGYAKEHRRYTRNPGDPHWNGYDRQPVVVYDDLGAVVQAGETSDIAETIGIKSNCPQSVKMADLEEKGKMFGSDFIIASTNITALDANTDVRTHGAFYRRRDILVKVMRRGPRNPDDLADGLVYQLYKMNPNNVNQREDGKPDDSGIVPVGKEMKYDMFLEFCYLKSKEHLDAQTRLVNFIKRLQETTKQPPDVFQLELKFRDFFEGNEDLPKASDTYITNPLKCEPMSSVECNSEGYVYNENTIQEEYDRRGYRGKSISAIFDELPYYEERLEECPSHKFEDHVRSLCTCDISKQFRDENCCGNEFCERLLKFNAFAKKKKKCMFIGGNYSGDVSVTDMTQLELFHVLVYLRYLSTPRNDGVCVLGEILKKFLKPKVMEVCLEYRVEKFDFPLGSTLIQHEKGFKILLWDGIADMFPHLMLQYGGVWIMDTEEIFLITDHIQVEYPADLRNNVHQSIKYIIERGCLLGMRELLKHVPEDDIVIFRDMCSTMGSLNDMMKLSKSQIQLLVEIKEMYGSAPLWILLLLVLFERSHENHLVAEREKKYKRQREVILLNIERYKEQESKWYEKCSQGTRIALGCGAGLLALCSILGMGALMWKSVSIFFPSHKKEIEPVTDYEVTVDEIEIPKEELVAQAAAGGQSGDFKTKYRSMRKKVKISGKKHIAIKNSEYTTEELHMETAQKINAIAQKCGANRQILEGTGLMHLSQAVIKEVFEELDKDIVKAVHKKFPAAKNIIEKAVSKVYEGNDCDNCVYECAEGKVIIPKNVNNMIEILGFDESNRAKKGEQPSHFNPDKVREELADLIKEDGYKGPLKNKVIAHKNLRDIRAEQLQRVVLRDANAQIYFPSSKKRAQVVRVFGDVIIFPIHYIDDFKEGETFNIAISNSVHQLTFESSRLITFAAGQDLIAYRCGSKVPAARDIRSHFVTVDDVMRFKPCEGYLTNTCCGVKGTTQYIDYTPQMNLITHENYPSGVYYEAGTMGSHNLTWALQYPIHSANGFCGSIISRISHTHERKVMGIHVAANGNFNYGYAELVTQESLDLLYAECVRIKQKPLKPSADIEVMKMPIVANSEGDFEIEEEENRGTMPYKVELKKVTFVGEVPSDKVPRENNVSAIQPSIFHGLFGEVHTEPSILSEFDGRLTENEFHGDLHGLWHPGIDGVSKYGESVKIFPDKDIQCVESHLIDMFANAENSLNRRSVLTEDEMINGIRDTLYWEQIDMHTAPGYPYALSRPKGEKGKAYLFKETVEEDGRKTYEVQDPLLRERIDSRECCARACETFPTIALEKVKDERRKLKKIYQKPATRTFSCLPVDLNLLYRKYFLDFAVMQMENRDEFACKVGINPDSLEWTRLYHMLASQGGTAFAGDYGKFDGIGMPDIYMSITNVINAWYNDGNDDIRRVLVHELFHRYSLCGKRLFRIDQGMPSGFSMTVIFNSLMNYYFLAIAWLHLTKGMKFEKAEDEPASPLEAFVNMTEIATYGDDNVVAISDSIKDIYNLRTVSKFLAGYGITYTDDQKRPIDESAPYVHVREVTFLKRGFSPMDKGKFIMRAPLDKISITEQIQWIKVSPTPKEALLANCENALYEASIYGEEYYTKILQRLNKLVAMQKWNHPFESYKNQLSRWWKNITMCDDYAHIHQLISDGKIVSGRPLHDLKELENFECFKEECMYAGIPPVAFEIDLGDENFN